MVWRPNEDSNKLFSEKEGIKVAPFRPLEDRCLSQRGPLSMVPLAAKLFLQI